MKVIPGTVLPNFEKTMEVLDLRYDLCLADLRSQSAQFIDLEHFNVDAEPSAQLRQVCRDVEHTAVVVAHQPKAATRKRMHDLGGTHPLLDFAPAIRIVLQHACHLVKRDLEPAQHIGDLGNGT